MAWHEDNLTAAETLIHRGEHTKIGQFSCDPGNDAFWHTPAIDNDVFVLPRLALHLQRNDDGFFFVEPGGLLLHRAGSELSRRPVGKRGAIRPDLFVETLKKYRLDLNDMGKSFVLPAPGRLSLLGAIRAANDGVVDSDALDARLFDIFEEICALKAGLSPQTSAKRPTTRSRRDALIDRVREYLHANLSKPLDLKRLADDLGSSPFHLTRTFREMTGLTPGEYRTRLKAGAIIETLVRNPAQNLAALAADHGFSNQSHMNRMLRREVGMTPSQIRGFA